MCALGAVGVCLALPRRGLTPQVVGAAVAGLAAGVVVLTLTLKNPEHRPNVYFYIFAAVALGSAVRVITHPKPVYAALYFILTIIASAGLYLVLSAEFMAFALIIVYAGAILITYLFVIMLASQSASEETDKGEQEYDISAREPIAASVVGFLLLATLTAFAFRGAAELPGSVSATSGLTKHPLSVGVVERETAILADMPRRVEQELRRAGLLKDGDKVVVSEDGAADVDLAGGTIGVVRASGGTERVAIPAGFMPKNVESVGFNLLRDHPGSIEIAGVVLLMAMLGAVVLSRKQVELDEELKKQQAHRLAGEPGEGGAA